LKITNLTGPIVIEAQDTTIASATQLHPLLTRAVDLDGNEYVYVKGVASGIVGAVCTFDEAGVTALAVSGTIGPVCVFTALLSSATATFGWACIYGKVKVIVAEDVDDNDVCYSTATPGALGDSAVVRINNAVFRAGILSGALGYAQIAYPTMAM
jgi:hypothetical protein